MTNTVNSLLVIPFLILRLVLPWLLVPMAILAFATAPPGFSVPFLAFIGLMIWWNKR
jgi:hypothetical protein